MTEVTCIQCPNCCNILYPRCKNDRLVCSCSSVGIELCADGTLSIEHMPHLKKPEAFKLQVLASEQELYKDWNYAKDCYGIYEM